MWDVPKEFRKIIYNESLFGNGLINFSYDIIDVNNDLKKEELMKNKNVSSAIFLLDQKMDLMEFFNRIKAVALYFSELSDVERKSLKHWIRNTMENSLAETAISILETDREDVELMVANNAFLLKETLDKTRAEGREKGLKEGIKEGRAEGRAEGKIDGILLAKKVFKLFSSGETMENISKICNISIEDIKNILE